MERSRNALVGGGLIKFFKSLFRRKNVVEADATRLQIMGPLSKTDAEWIRAHPSAKVIQISEPLDRKSIRLLNEYVFKERPEYLFRIYWGLPQLVDT